MRNPLDELKHQLKEELKEYELIDNDSKVHYNLITTEVCYKIASRYLQALHTQMLMMYSQNNKQIDG